MTNYTFDNLEKLRIAKEADKLVIFVGAGVSMNSGIPSWKSLIQALAEKIDLESKEINPEIIAQLYYNKRKHRAYYDSIRELLRHGEARYNSLNELILKLNPNHIITTNYDDLFDQILTNDKEKYSIIRRNEDLPKASLNKYLIKMHGCIQIENIVLKEDDYFNYSNEFGAIEKCVQTIFATNIVLFVGFSYDDYNLKKILKRLNNSLGNKFKQHFIFFDKPKSQFEIDYLGHQSLIPILYEEIIDAVERTPEGVIQNLYEPGRKVYEFLKIIYEYDFIKYKLEKLPIIKQIEKSLLPFKEFRILMPDVFQDLFPFNIKSDNVEIEKPFYNRYNPVRIDFNNPQILNLFSWTLNSNVTNSNHFKKIYSIEILKNKYHIVNDKLIEDLTDGFIANTFDYNIFQKFLDKLNSSYFYYIDKFNAYLTSKENDCKCIECSFEKFDFLRVVTILHNEAFDPQEYPKDTGFGKHYLIKGFYANKIGFRSLAYDFFKRSEKEAIKINNEVLRFFSLYNLKNFRSVKWGEWDTNEQFKEEQNKINLSEILTSLNLPLNVKKELEKILNDTYLNDGHEFIDELNKNLKKKWEIFEKGGRSFGGNELCTSVLTSLRLIRYFELNFLVDTEYLKIHNIAETAFESCVVSHTINNNEQNQKKSEWINEEILNEFKGVHLHFFIHYSSSEWHKEELKKLLGSKKIKISIQTQNDIFKGFSNFLDSYYKLNSNHEYFPQNQVIAISPQYTFKILGNFLELIYISDLSNDITVMLLPKVINFISVIHFPNWAEESQLKGFINVKGSLFSSNQLIQLIEIFIKKGITHYIKELIDHIKDDNLKLVVSVEDLAPFFKERSYNYLKALGYIHSLTNADIQLKIEQHLEERLITNFNSITFLQLFDYNCFDKEKLTAKYIQEEKSLLKEKYPQENSVSLNNFLQFISRNYTNPNIQKLAKEPIKNTYVDWLLNFNTFDYQYFNLDWFKFFITQFFIKLMKQNQEVKKQLREFLLINKDVELQNQYSGIYLENFERN